MIVALIREPVVSLVKDGKQLARMLQTHIKIEAADCTTVDENVVQYHDKFSALLNIIRQRLLKHPQSKIGVFCR